MPRLHAALCVPLLLAMTHCAGGTTLEQRVDGPDAAGPDADRIRPLPDAEGPGPAPTPDDVGDPAPPDAQPPGDAPESGPEDTDRPSPRDTTPPAPGDATPSDAPAAPEEVDVDPADADPTPSDAAGPVDTAPDVVAPADVIVPQDVAPADVVVAQDTPPDAPPVDAAPDTQPPDVAEPADVTEPEDTDPPDTGEPGVCQAPRTLCGDDCVSLLSSAAHCGRCNQACPAWQGCVGGVCACDNDAWEPNDHAGQATRLPLGDLRPAAGTTGALSHLRLCPGDADWFRLDMAGQSGDAVFELTGDCTRSDINPVLELVTDTGSVMQSATGGGTGGCPRLTATLDRTAPRYLRVRATHTGNVAAVQLQVHFTQFRETSGNQSRPAASGTWHRPFMVLANLDGEAADNVDFFRIDLHYGGTFTFASSMCGVEHDIELQAEDGTVLQGGIRAGTCASISRALVPGRYFVRAWPRSTREWGSYRLTMTGSPTFEVEPNNAVASATRLTGLPVSGEGALEREDVDVWRFTLSAPTSLRVQTRGVFHACEADTALELRRADGTLIAASSEGGAVMAGGAGTCAELRASTTPALQNLPAGEYLVAVRGDAGARGAYLLNLLAD